MAKTFSKLPTDPWFDSINPLLYSFMFLSWIRDQEEEHKFAEEYSILTGSFANPAMAHRMRNQENRTHMEVENFDQKFEQTEELLSQHLNTKKSKKKKKKLKIT